MDPKNLTPELREKAKSCKTPEEVFALAKEEGYELSEEELSAVSGGNWFTDPCRGDYCDMYYDA